MNIDSLTIATVEDGRITGGLKPGVSDELRAALARSIVMFSEMMPSSPSPTRADFERTTKMVEAVNHILDNADAFVNPNTRRLMEGFRVAVASLQDMARAAMAN